MSGVQRRPATTEVNVEPYRNVLEHLEDYDLQEGGGLPLDKGITYMSPAGKSGG
jgi:hypothetical protein